MPTDLSSLAAAAHTAVLTMEMQRGVVGDLTPIPDLAAAVTADGTVANTARVLEAAGAAGARVVHCTAERPTMPTRSSATPWPYSHPARRATS
jgi:nicotinamidase-related amidase